MRRFIPAVGAIFLLVVFVSLAEAINISVAEVQNGVAVVQGGKAAPNAIIVWEGGNVATTNRGGGFSFAGRVPSDCVGTLSDGVITLDVALAYCTPAPPPPTGGVLATGQTQCYDSFGIQITCSGTGQDGAVQKGVVRSYKDNGDGTITDNVTGLMWEKLCSGAGCPSINDVSAFYTWADAFRTKIAALNSAPCFAGHCDWRLPNINELQTLADYGKLSPAIDPVFDNGIDSFTYPSFYYWSSSTYQDMDMLFPAWCVFSRDGSVSALEKTALGFVRAVRGGS